MKTITEYKDLALNSLEGNWTRATLASLIVFLLLEIVGSSPSFLMDPVPGMVAQGLITILLIPLAWGYAVFFLRLIRQENIDYGRLFDGFSDYFRIFVAELLKGIYVLLWSLLLIVPGIIKTYSYAMTEFILKDNPEISGEKAICESMRMMQGHKMQLFLLDLSMIGWLILSLLTLGIGLLFLYPYYYSAHAHFYEDLKTKEL
jgi:uncharacterized membrane protein